MEKDKKKEKKQVEESTTIEEEEVKEVKRKSYNFTRRYSYDTAEVNKNVDFRGISEDEWKERMVALIEEKTTDDVDLLAYIFHDKDEANEEEKKLGKSSLHLHVLVRFKTSKLDKEVRELFGVNDREQNCQPIKSLVGSSRYLTHRTKDAMNERKYQYNADEVICYGAEYMDMITEEFWGTKPNKTRYVSPEKAKQIVAELGQKIYTGEMRKHEALDELEEKAGYFYRRQYRDSFDGDVDEYVESKVREMTANGRENQTIYITGSGGIGKTALGSALGNKIGGEYNLYTSAPLGVNKTPDALNHYRDEDVALFNEISPRGWSIDEFNACFDFYAYAPFPARNENKHFIGHTSIFTNSLSPVRFAKDLLIYSKGGSEYQDPANKREINKNNATALDKYWQVRRRLMHIVVLLRDETDGNVVHAHLFKLRYGLYNDKGEYCEEDGTHIHVGMVPFVAVPNTKPEITDEILDEILELFETDVNSEEVREQQKENDTIDEFLEKHNLMESSSDEVMESFVDEVLPELKWDLLPTEFLYDLYKEFRNRYYQTEDLLTVKEFVHAFDVYADGWTQTKSAVRTSGRMILDEPIITEYNLENWINKSYKGSNNQKLRAFPRKERYRGFLRNA